MTELEKKAKEVEAKVGQILSENGFTLRIDHVISLVPLPTPLQEEGVPTPFNERD